jgi:sporulation protein YlmC with PRC-barrel domain
MKNSKLNRSRWIGLMFAALATAAFLTTGTPAAAAETMLFSRILDHPVVNAEGADLGEIEDLVLRRNGRVKQALISLDGFLGIEDKDVSVFYRKLQFPEENTIRLDVTVDQLDKRSDFNYRKPELYTGIYERHMLPGVWGGPRGPYANRYDRYPEQQGQGEYLYYPYEGPWRRYPIYDWPSRRGPRTGDAGGAYYHPWHWAYFPEKILASTLLGRTVVNAEGQEVAEVSDLVINDQTRKIEKLVLETGGFLGIAEKRVAVDYRPFGLTAYGITYDITEKELNDMPDFKR